MKLLQPLQDIQTDGLLGFPDQYSFAGLVGIQYCSYSETALVFAEYSDGLVGFTGLNSFAFELLGFGKPALLLSHPTQN